MCPRATLGGEFGAARLHDVAVPAGFPRPGSCCEHLEVVLCVCARARACRTGNTSTSVWPLLRT